MNIGSSPLPLYLVSFDLEGGDSQAYDLAHRLLELFGLKRTVTSPRSVISLPNTTHLGSVAGPTDAGILQDFLVKQMSAQGLHVKAMVVVEVATTDPAWSVLGPSTPRR